MNSARALVQSAAGRRAILFVAVLLTVWILAGLAFGSAVGGFLGGLVAATFATGAATLNVRRDGSFTLRKRR